MAAITSTSSVSVLPEAILGRVGSYRIRYESEITDIVAGIFNACVFCKAAGLTERQKKAFFQLTLPGEAAGKVVRGHSVLMEAAGQGNIAVLRVLLSDFWEEAKVHAKDETGNTALMHVAIQYGWGGPTRTIQDEDGKYLLLSKCHLEAMKLLLQFTSDVNAKDRLGRTALHYAMGAKDTAAAGLLLEHRANPNAESFGIKFTPSHWAARFGNVEGLKLLKKYKANLNALFAMNGNYLRPLDYAAALGKTQVVKWWISQGTTLEQDDSFISVKDLHDNRIYIDLPPGNSPTSWKWRWRQYQSPSYALRLAILNGHRDTARAMCYTIDGEFAIAPFSAASDRDWRTGYNALHTAIASDKVWIARDMMKLVDLQAKTKSGETALAMARRLGNKEIIRDLIQAGAID